MNSERQCYGKMFPSIINMAHNQHITGKIFGYELYYSGQVVQKRSATVDHDAWQECVKCAYLDSCYRLSTGMMLIELALKAAPETQYR